MRKIIKVGLGTAGALVLAAGPAFADLAPGANDEVGVGSDTVQNIANFVADGDPTGDPGYNSAGNNNRLFTFDATPDANDRTGYLNGSTSAALKPLNPTIVLRAGTSPIQRPNGSGAGISALLADTTQPYKINFVRSSRPPKASEQHTAVTDGFGSTISGVDHGLRVVQLSTDPLSVAETPTTHAPVLSAQELVGIYQCTTTTWNALPGNSGGSTATIIPLIPQAGSGTRSTFLSDLQAANGGTAVTLGGCVQTVEENDPASITGSTSPDDTIAPFSGGRINLYNSGYFHNPNVAFPGGAALTSGIQLQTTGGNAGDGHSAYLDTRGLYIIFRANDATSATPWQPGGTKNWAQELFIFKGTSKPFVATTNGLADVAAAGATAAYNDLGDSFSVG
jgi:hypothetical protein